MHRAPILLLLIAACGSNRSSNSDAGPETPSIDGSVDPDATTRVDHDEDGILDTEEGMAEARDTDEDGTPDYLDTDSDNDSIPDAVEAGDDDLETAAVDSDGDTTPDYIDADSDDDCIADAAEAGDTDLATPPVDTDSDTLADYLDTDSDADLLLDATEDANCDGIVDAAESSRVLADSDSDGDSDLVEFAMGTDATNPDDSSASNGTPVFLAPHQEVPEPAAHELTTAAAASRLDVYVLTDRSGSLAQENAQLANDMTTVASNLLCPPMGTGTPGDCLDDVWWGTGAVGTTGGDAYVNGVDMQPDPAVMAAAINTTEPPGCCGEPMLLALHSTVTGGDSDAGGECTIASSYPARANCTGSPADLDGQGGFGYPCFRDNAQALIVLVTDEAPTQTHNCPSLPLVANEASTFLVQIAGVDASANDGQVATDLGLLASGTSAVDTTNGGLPIVVPGAGLQASTALQTVIETVTRTAPFAFVRGFVVDDPSDSVDAVATFVERFETNQSGIGSCTNGLAEADRDFDTFPDTYLDVTSRTPLCFNIVPKTNELIAEGEAPALFRIDVDYRANTFIDLGNTSVFFLVPPSEPI